MKINKLFLFAALLFFSGASSYAQVRIGGLTPPATGVLLDLNSDTRGGLVLSNVTITDLEKIPFGNNVFSGITDADADVNIALRGTIVYNDGQGTTVPSGIYVWNGYYWTQDGNCNPVVTASSPLSVSVIGGSSTTLSVDAVGCDIIKYQWYELNNGNATEIPTAATAKTYSTPNTLTEGITHYYYCKVSSYSDSDAATLGETTSDMFTVNVAINPINMTAGSGDFTGATCLDVMVGNNGVNGGAPHSLRRQTNFNTRTLQYGTTGSLSGVQEYTFTPKSEEAVSHVRFEYVETSGLSIDSIVPASSTYATGNGISTACTVKVYYREDLAVELVNKTSITGNKLKLYAIYNSDAVYSTSANDHVLGLTVSLQDGACCGAYTDKVKGEWLPFMCYNLGVEGNNEKVSPFEPAAAIHGAKYKWGVKAFALSQTEDQLTSSGISDWANKGGTPPSGSGVVWDMTDANPCPDGWRLPTIGEWESVINENNNTRNKVGDKWDNLETNYDTGYKLGDALFLPAAGRRHSGTSTGSTPGILEDRGAGGYYWASTADGSASGRCLSFLSSDLYTYSGVRAAGYSVRCVAK
jgi:uncharacterized protein (TIGR02145 family)